MMLFMEITWDSNRKTRRIRCGIHSLLSTISDIFTHCDVLLGRGARLLISHKKQILILDGLYENLKAFTGLGCAVETKNYSVSARSYF